MMQRRAVLLLLTVVMTATLMMVASPAWADTTFTVNSNADTDDGCTIEPNGCTLREAIFAADAASGNDTIVFDLGQTATITLVGSTLPTITDASGLTIDGGQSASITISGNQAVGVFGVGSGAKLTLNNLTVANGRSASNGGGILNDGGTLTVSNSTFSNNRASNQGGGGIFINNDSDFPVTLRNTIVAYSPSGGNCAIINGTITDGGYNIDDGITCGFSEQQNSLPSTNPLLADQPANNGDPTQTIALLAGSPAINAIPPSVNGCGTDITTDQRGVSRPQGPACDIGAYELEDNTAPTITGVTPTENATKVARNTNVTATFSEAMNPNTLTSSTVTLAKVGFRGKTTPVTAPVTVSEDGKTVTIEPSKNLVAFATYRATIKGGSSGAKDLAGNPLDTDKVWSFKTTFR